MPVQSLRPRFQQFRGSIYFPFRLLIIIKDNISVRSLAQFQKAQAQTRRGDTIPRQARGQPSHSHLDTAGW